MDMIEHGFTQNIRNIIENHFPGQSEKIFNQSKLIQYINHKTKSANKGSKSRSSFGNLYAIYVLCEDYINQGYFESNSDYSEYQGARFSNLFKRQRELPFGSKLQNHAFNHRLNEEFKKFFSPSDDIPIIRDSNQYWINTNLLKLNMGGNDIDLSKVIIDIINDYIEVKQSRFNDFIEICENLKNEQKINDSIEFIGSLLGKDVDARVFEIASYAILKERYKETEFFWGYSLDEINKVDLELYKTGRTNANDGGIDFVMKPLGRFFQVTETFDLKKYFLDIDKVHHFPVTFVIKTSLSEEEIYSSIYAEANKMYPVKAIVKKYMGSIEEVINIPKLKEILQNMSQYPHKIQSVLSELVTRSKLEFNYDE